MRAALACALLCALVSAPVEAREGSLRIEQGRPIDAALEELRARGLRVLWSTALVDPSLRAPRSVEADDAEQLARLLLRQVGLELRPLGSGLLGVVESPSGLRWRLAGRIAAEVDDAPLPSARIEFVEDGLVAWSDSSGSFATELHGRNPRTLRVSAEGYATVLAALSYPLDAAGGPLRIRLRPAAPELAEVTVVASRFTYDEIAARGARFLLEQAAIVGQPKLGEDAIQALARLPGVASSGFSARPNIRGGESSELLVVLDGMPIREAFHLSAYNAALSIVDDALVERLDAWTGTLPLQHGNRLGSIVELRSALPPGATPHALGLSTFNARARTGHAGTDAHDTSWLLSLRDGMVRRWISRYAQDVGRPDFRDGFAAFSTTTRDGTQLELRALGSDSELAFADRQTGEHALLRGEARYVWLNVARSADDGFALSGTLGYTAIDSERLGTVAEGLVIDGEVRDRRSSRLWDLALRARWNSAESRTLEFGIGASGGRGEYDYASESEFEPIAATLFGIDAERERQARTTLERTRLAAHLELRQQLGAQVYLEAGARLEHDASGTDGTRWNPRLALRWDSSPATSWRASLARAHQIEEVHELRIEDGETRLGAAQRADQLVLGVEHRTDFGAALRLEAYERRIRAPRTRFENLYDPLRFLPELSADRVAVAPRSARLRGLEASLQWRSGPWSIWAATTWSTARDRYADGRAEPRAWDAPLALNFALNWRRGPWQVGLAAQHRSGRPTTPLITTSSGLLRLGPRSSARLGPYTSGDLRIQREFDVSLGRLAAWAQITNVFNRRNPCCVEIDRPDDDADPRSLEIEPIYSYPAVPALGLQWEF